ncbi:MAG: NAD-dependent epimerase/dehydratase family protein, partial [Gemmatimonadales bacterium]
MRVLVTGADGFVGSHLVPMLGERGHEVVAAVRPGFERREGMERLRGLGRLALELEDADSVRAA